MFYMDVYIYKIDPFHLFMQGKSIGGAGVGANVPTGVPCCAQLVLEPPLGWSVPWCFVPLNDGFPFDTSHT